MTPFLTIPQINSGSLKDQIISLLGENGNLRAKEIYSKLSTGNAITYQAVHKALTELTNETILEKKQSIYSINIKWINNLKVFINQIEQKSDAIKTITETEQTLEFDKLYTFLESMLHLFASDILYKDCSHNYGGGILTHLWWPLSFNDEEYKKFIHMSSSHDSYILVPTSTPVDIWLKSYYEKTGFKGIMLNSKYKIEDDLALVGDYLIYVFLTPEMKEKINQLYSNTNLSEAINKGILETILMEKTRIRVTVVKNAGLVKQYWEKILPYFGKKAVFK